MNIFILFEVNGGFYRLFYNHGGTMKKLEIYDKIVAGMRDTYIRKNQDNVEYEGVCGKCYPKLRRKL
jgi:hypothetical protein